MTLHRFFEIAWRFALVIFLVLLACWIDNVLPEQTLMAGFLFGTAVLIGASELCYILEK